MMKIKCLLAALAFSSIFCLPVQAHNDMETRHEVAVSYGTVPNSIWIDVYTDLIPAMFGETHKTKNRIGPIGLEYYYHTSSLIGVGAVAVFNTNKMDTFYKEVQSSLITRSYFSFLPSVKFNWLRRNNWGLYSKVAAGVTYANFKDEDYLLDCVSNSENPACNSRHFATNGTSNGRIFCVYRDFPLPLQ